VCSAYRWNYFHVFLIMYEYSVDSYGILMAGVRDDRYRQLASRRNRRANHPVCNTFVCRGFDGTRLFIVRPVSRHHTFSRYRNSISIAWLFLRQ
jgi:hypothetical protein